jgi:hypothetical protein
MPSFHAALAFFVEPVVRWIASATAALSWIISDELALQVPPDWVVRSSAPCCSMNAFVALPSFPVS